MKNKDFWINISILNLFIVSVLGFILRSKILFSLPSINFLNFLDAHFHFAFDGWITFSLLILMVDSLLPGSLNKKPAYQWIFGVFLILSFGILVATILDNNGFPAKFFTFLLILVTYIFFWVFFSDIRNVRLNRSVRILSVSAITCLIISSAGPLAVAWLHAVRSSQIFYFSDATYIYLHFQYNGFFTLGIFALLVHKIFTDKSERVQRRLYLFSVLLCCSVVPSLFLSFLWQDPTDLVRMIALAGSILVFLSVTAFLFGNLPLFQFSGIQVSWVRYLLLFSTVAFIIKMYLQGFTIFPVIGKVVFGDRPIIIGFLHLVFLGFVTPSILAFYIRNEVLRVSIRLTVIALSVFMAGILLNEIILMLQGLGVMFLKSSILFSWLLWAISILLAGGALLILISRIKSINSSYPPLI